MRNKYFILLGIPLALSISLYGCGGGGGGSTPPPPLIQALLFSFPPGSEQPAQFANALVSVTDSSSGENITTASVTLNGVILTYNAAPTRQEYEGNLEIKPGDPVTLIVTVGGNTYTASGTQFTSYPTISTPVSGATWVASSANTVMWSGGLPLTNAAYLLGVLDATDPNGGPAYFQVLATNVNSFSIPPNSLTEGSSVVIVGIVTPVSIPHAATDSTLVFGEFNYVPITVATATNATLISLALTPTSTVITKGSTQQFIATGKYSDNSTQNLTSQVTWSTTDNSKTQISSTGLATGTGVGSTTITAALGSISGSTSITVVAGFAPGVHYPDPSTSIHLGNTAVGDLNGDGRNDVAVLEASGTRILIYYQIAGGALDSAMTITTDLNLRGIATGDVNNDGLADLIVSGNSTTTSGPLGRLAVFMQNQTTHALDAPQEYTLSINNVGPLAIADLNDDGLLDMVSAGTGTGSNGVVSLLFQGVGGTLLPEVTYTNVPVVVDGELHVSDMNNDGKNDIVLQSGEKQLAVIKQASPGTFSNTPDFYAIQTSYWPFFRSFALGDVSGDGQTDIIVADPGNSGYLNIFLQNVGGTLTGPTLKTVSSNVQDEVHIADIDGDGLNDIILLSYGNTVQILYQDTNHSFLVPVTYYLPTSSSGGTIIHQALSEGDLNVDGLPDIVSSWSNEGIFILSRLP